MPSGFLVLSCAFLPVTSAQTLVWMSESEKQLKHEPAAMMSGMTAEDLNCFSAFAAFNFNLSDFSRYPEFFDDNSVMILPPAGEYKGAEAIEEYVKFPSAGGAVTESLEVVDYESGYFGIQDGLCSFYQWFVTDSVSTALSNHYTSTTVAGVKLLFNANTSKIDFTYPAYTGTYLSTAWSLRDTTATAEFVCQIMEDHCPAAFALANLTSQADCLQRFNSLPMVSGDYWFDGNSKSCRLMHASFSATNPQHCPHISFEPQADQKGKIKCQTSLLQPVDLYFSSSEWQAFETFAAKKGVPTGIRVTTPTSPPIFTDSCSGPQAAAAVLVAVFAALWH